jgi:phenylacetate-CoA ligase
MADLGIEAVCTHSELSTSDERGRFAAAFGVDVFDEYASEELYLIATQCRFGQYHIVDDNVRVDVIGTDAETNEGKIVATSLTNGYMPLIKYRQDDIVELGSRSQTCECGSTFRILRKIRGREYDQLIRADGSKVDIDRVIDLYNSTIMAGGSGIAGCTIYQVDTGVLEVVAELFDGRAPNARDSLDVFVSGLREAYSPDIPNISINMIEERRPRPGPKPRLVVPGAPPEPIE